MLHFEYPKKRGGAHQSCRPYRWRRSGKQSYSQTLFKDKFSDTIFSPKFKISFQNVYVLFLLIKKNKEKEKKRKIFFLHLEIKKKSFIAYLVYFLSWYVKDILNLLTDLLWSCYF